MDRYSKYIDLDIDGITSKDVISISVTPASAATASYAQFANPETFDGYVRLRAVSVPTTAITAQYYIVQGGGQTDSGSGTVVEGYTKAQVDNKIAAAIKIAKEEQKLLDHPVGSIYQSVEPTSPAELFGGEWQKIEDRMLIAASSTYPVKSTGGETTHEHNWGLRYNLFYGGFMGEDNKVLRGLKYNEANIAGTVEGVNIGDSKEMVSNTGIGDAYTTNTRNSAGYNLISNTSSASSMPPYLVAYMWYRTA